MIQYLFYTLSILAIFSALMVVFSKNPVHSVLYLILCFFSIAGHFILLSSEFLFIVQVIVYAGAIMVLFMFVLMFLNLNKEAEPHKPTMVKFAGVIAAGLLLVTLVGSMKGMANVTAPSVAVSQIGTVASLGKVLFNDFAMPFEVSSILFLSAMVGSVFLGKKDIQ
jgi:NADH-quinone oxidoreductase subunit J